MSTEDLERSAETLPVSTRVTLSYTTSVFVVVNLEARDVQRVCAGRWRSTPPRRDRHGDKPCLCLGDLLFRGPCCGCDWEGEPRDDENAAAEDACDHAWPGWRALPVVERMPEEHKPRARLERVIDLYPPGWVHAGRPIRTHRTGMGRRHVPSRTPFGGYDMAGEPDAVDPG